MTTEIQWMDEPDYAAAAKFLSLLNLVDPRGIIDGLKTAPAEFYFAKDVLRASKEPLLGRDNTLVKNDLQKIYGGEQLSPVLLVRGNLHQNRSLVIADGYHRVCAAYLSDENSTVKCRIV